MEESCSFPEKKESCPLSLIEKRKKRHWFTSVEDGCKKCKRKLKFYGLENLPYFMLLVSLIQVVIHCAAGESVKKVLIYEWEKRREIWRFVTYMLLHTDSVHLGLNLIIQVLLGVPLETEQGHLRCAVVYFGGGLAGSLGASVFAAFSLMAGASGGVYALLTAQIPNVVLNYGTIKYAGYRILVVVMLTASDFIYICLHVYLYNNEKPRIGWVAHASGALAGFPLGFLAFNGTSKWEKKLRLISGIILLAPCLLSLAHSLLKLFPYSLKIFS